MLNPLMSRGESKLPFVRFSKTLERQDLLEAGIPVDKILSMMGRVYAILHFHCRVNGDDIEFHLGSCRNSETGYRVWVLDMDRCKRMDMTDPEHIAFVFMRNDLVIPRGRCGELGYEAFKGGYLETAESLSADNLDVAQQVMLLFEGMQVRRDRR